MQVSVALTGGTKRQYAGTTMLGWYRAIIMGSIHVVRTYRLERSWAGWAGAGTCHIAAGSSGISGGVGRLVADMRRDVVEAQRQRETAMEDLPCHTRGLGEESAGTQQD